MVAPLIGTSASKGQAFSCGRCAAAQLGPAQRAALSVHALAGNESVTHLAKRHNVSRQFVYRQATKASDAIDQAFTPSTPDGRVLFDLPVTKPWLRQFVLAQVLIGHTSSRGVMEILDAVFDYRDISLGTIHNIVAEAVDTARRVNDAEDLSAIAVGAHDEIYQAGRPVFVGADVRSTYCYLLAAEDHCDETTWGVHLLDLRDQGLRPERIVADGGKALRAGQAAAWGEEVPCYGDVFHAERDLGGLASYLDHRAAACTTVRRKLEGKMERWKKRAKGQGLSKKLALARQAEAKAVALARDVRILSEWMHNHILCLAGADLPTRRELFDFVSEELRRREEFCPHRIGPVRRMLEGRRDDLLGFAGIVDERLGEVALRCKAPRRLVHAVCELLGMDPNQPAYWQREAQLRRKLTGRFHAVQTEVRQVLAETPRASSIAENINSRVRNYFFLRRHVGNGYLELLRFFLNHRRLLRSDRPEGVGKSPCELLTGQPHRHWLEVLRHERFQRN